VVYGYTKEKFLQKNAPEASLARQTKLNHGKVFFTEKNSKFSSYYLASFASREIDNFGSYVAALRNIATRIGIKIDDKVVAINNKETINSYDKTGKVVSSEQTLANGQKELCSYEYQLKDGKIEYAGVKFTGSGRKISADRRLGAGV